MQLITLRALIIRPYRCPRLVGVGARRRGDSLGVAAQVEIESKR